MNRLAALVLMSLALPVVVLAGSADVPASEDRLSEPWWAERHDAILKSLHEHSDAELVLIGDSITQNYEKANPPDESFQPTWNEFYQPRKAVNLGYSGDTTSNVLWRLRHGELSGLKPRVALVLIGTNDTAKGRTAEQTKAGIDAIVAELEQQLPATHVLLIGLLPSDISAAKTQADRRVNQLLAASYAHDTRVTYIDVGHVFYKNGELDTSIFYDPRLPWHAKALHPDTTGQHMMAEAIEPTLKRLMRK